MNHSISTIQHIRQSLRWVLFTLFALALSFSPTSAQSEVTIYAPVNGRFVRGTNVITQSSGREVGTVNTYQGIWSIFQTPFLSMSTRPLWSANGQEIAFGFGGIHSGMLNFNNDEVVFSTESVLSLLNSPVGVIFISGLSENGRSLTITYTPGGPSAIDYLANINLDSNTVEEIRSWLSDEQVTNMPLPPDATEVQLVSSTRIERNPVFGDWFVMQFGGSGYYSTFDIGEPVRADINVLWNFRTNEYISLDNILPNMFFGNQVGDWSHDGTRLLLSGRTKDTRENYLITLRFNPNSGVTVSELAISDNRSLQHWLDAGDLFFTIINDYQDGAAYMLAEIVDGEYREMPFFTLNGDKFRQESIGDWYMDADQAERNRLSCIFEWSLPTRLAIGDIAQVTQDDGLGLRLRAKPDRFSEQVGSLDDGESVTISGETACSGGYRWWFITTNEGLTGWAAEANRDKYFLELPSLIHMPPMLGGRD